MRKSRANYDAVAGSPALRVNNLMAAIQLAILTARTLLGEYMRKVILLSICIGLLSLPWRAANAAAFKTETLVFTVYDFPPDIYDTANAPKGPLVDKLVEILTLAGIQHTWKFSSIPDETQLLDENDEALCSSGRFYTHERAKKWHYIPYTLTNALNDVIVVRKDQAKRFLKHEAFLDIINDPAFKGSFIPGASYGNQIDKILLKKPNWLDLSSPSMSRSLSMVYNGQADYTLIPLQAWVTAYDNSATLKELTNLNNQILGSQNAVEPIFIACSKRTPLATLQRISDAMGQLGYRIPQATIRTDIRPYIRTEN